MDIIKPHYEHIYCIFVPVKQLFIKHQWCLLNRFGKQNDTSHLFLQMIQANYPKSFALNVILSCFKLSNVFSKNRSENLASKMQFHIEFISYRRIALSSESGIPKTEIVKSTICLHPILFSKYTVQIPSYFTDRKVKNIETMRSFN